MTSFLVSQLSMVNHSAGDPIHLHRTFRLFMVPLPVKLHLIVLASDRVNYSIYVLPFPLREGALFLFCNRSIFLSNND